MNDHAALDRNRLTRSLVLLLAALCLAPLALAGPDDRPEKKGDAARVAKKVEKAQATAHDAEDEREALRHFQEDLEEYAALHTRQFAKLGNQESVATQKALAHAIAGKRAKAGSGDIFRPEVQAVFRRLLADQLEGPDALAARKAVLEGNPEEDAPVPVVVRVNAMYPVGAARSTVPPSLLLTLPPLPTCLHYRFVDRDLLLVDSVAQLIVDFLPAAAPELKVK